MLSKKVPSVHFRLSTWRTPLYKTRSNEASPTVSPIEPFKKPPPKLLFGSKHSHRSLSRRRFRGRTAGARAPSRTPPLEPPASSGFDETRANGLGVDPFSILFNHPSFQKPEPFSLGFSRVSRKKDPWKEWNWKVPIEMGGFDGSHRPMTLSAEKSGDDSCCFPPSKDRARALEELGTTNAVLVEIPRFRGPTPFKMVALIYPPKISPNLIQPWNPENCCEPQRAKTPKLQLGTPRMVFCFAHLLDPRPCFSSHFWQKWGREVKQLTETVPLSFSKSSYPSP